MHYCSFRMPMSNQFIAIFLKKGWASSFSLASLLKHIVGRLHGFRILNKYWQMLRHWQGSDRRFRTREEECWAHAQSFSSTTLTPMSPIKPLISWNTLDGYRISEPFQCLHSTCQHLLWFTKPQSRPTKHFSNKGGMKDEIRFLNMVASWYDMRIHKLLQHQQKCINQNGHMADR